MTLRKAYVLCLLFLCTLPGLVGCNFGALGPGPTDGGPRILRPSPIPSPSPPGRILYGSGDSIWQMDGGGRGKFVATTEETGPGQPLWMRWSPLQFVDGRLDTYADSGQWNIYMIDVHTKEIQRLTYDGATDMPIDWK